MRVLVVDDEEEIRDSLEEFLSDEGYAVSLAADGAEALSQLEQEPRPRVLDRLLDFVQRYCNA